MPFARLYRYPIRFKALGWRTTLPAQPRPAQRARPTEAPLLSSIRTIRTIRTARTTPTDPFRPLFLGRVLRGWEFILHLSYPKGDLLCDRSCPMGDEHMPLSHLRSHLVRSADHCSLFSHLASHLASHSASQPANQPSPPLIPSHAIIRSPRLLVTHPSTPRAI